MTMHQFLFKKIHLLSIVLNMLMLTHTHTHIERERQRERDRQRERERERGYLLIPLQTLLLLLYL